VAGKGIHNGVSKWKNKHRDCCYTTISGRCRLNKGKDCSKKNCKLLRGRGGLKINVYPLHINTINALSVLRKDVLRWFDLFTMDYNKKTELIIGKKDWAKLNKIPEPRKTSAVLELFKKRFKCKLEGGSKWKQL
jgi:hypothetical protein